MKEEEWEESLYPTSWIVPAEGFHPVLLGKENRYRVTHKLGNWGIATIWLCRDQETNGYVALKIMLAEEPTPDCAKLRLFNRGLDFTQPGGEHIAQPLDHFWVDGPNGRHLYVVFPVLGPRSDTIWQGHRSPDSSKAAARSIARQARYRVAVSSPEWDWTMSQS